MAHSFAIAGYAYFNKRRMKGVQFSIVWSGSKGTNYNNLTFCMFLIDFAYFDLIDRSIPLYRLY